MYAMNKLRPVTGLLQSQSQSQCARLHVKNKSNQFCRQQASSLTAKRPADFTKKIMATDSMIRTPSCSLCTSLRLRGNSTEGSSPEDPVKYSTSGAHSWRSMESFSVPQRIRDMPWYQPYSVIASVSIFLLYFCVLREENDIDEELRKSIYDRIPGLEEKNLIGAIEYERTQGRSTAELEKRLQQITS